jgi:SagB-type dehydrogenase family enzyme
MVSTQSRRLITSEPPATPVRESYRLRGDAILSAGPNGSLTLRHSRFELALPELGAGRSAVILRLAERWLDDNEVSQLVEQVEGEARILPAQLLLRRLIAHSWVQRRLDHDSSIVDIRPRGLGPDSQPRPVRHEPTTGYRLSQQTIIRADGDALIAYSPLSTVTVAFTGIRPAAILTLLAVGSQTVADIAAQTGLGRKFAERLLDELVAARVVESAADHAIHAVAPPHALWSPEELAVHERSRVGRHVQPVGGTYRFRGRVAAEPVRHPIPGAVSTALPRPDLDELARTEAPLTAVVGQRRSIRQHDDTRPITRVQLAEFLYRVGRTWDVREVDGQEIARRPYPTGGQICEIELYPLISRCADVSPGLYHYDSVDHRLELIAETSPLADRMLRYARSAAAMAQVPQVLLIGTARMTRLMWKYEGLAYSMALKNAGVLTGLMYLVATAMGLAPCGVGSGDAAAFAAMSGRDPLVEPSVADFLLGSRREPS